jgi:hypothetical protein
MCEDDAQVRILVEMMLASPRLGIPTPRRPRPTTLDETLVRARDRADDSD